MAAVGEYEEILDKLFTKGFVYDRGTNKIPYDYASAAENVRLINGGITKRLGFSVKYTDTGSEGKGITSNAITNALLYVYNGSLYEVDPDSGVATLAGSITSTNKARFINYGSYTIILTGDQKPFYYTGSTFLTFSGAIIAGNSIGLKVGGVAMTAVPYNTSNNQTLDDLATQLVTDFPTIIASAARNAGNNGVNIVPVVGQIITITDILITGGASQATGSITKLTQVTSGLDAGINPSFGSTFAGFTVVNNNAAPNIACVSMPISDTTQVNCVDREGSGSAKLSLRGKCEGFASTLSQLRFFTSNTIEYIDRSSIATTGALSSFYPIVYASSEPLASPDLVVAAGDKVFFVTKKKKIRAIGYQSDSAAETQIATLSDIKGASIQAYLDDNLKDDQSNGFAFYDEQRDLVKFWMTSHNSLVPDVCLIRDLVESTWLLDLDKYYGGIVSFGTHVYAMSGLSRTIYEDEIGYNDNGAGIQWRYATQDLPFGDPARYKQWRGYVLAGQANTALEMNVATFVDGKTVSNKKLMGAYDAPGAYNIGLGSQTIGGPIGDKPTMQGLLPFAKPVTVARLRSTGRKVRWEFSGNVVNSDFVLDYMSAKLRARKRYRINEKRFTSAS